MAITAWAKGVCEWVHVGQEGRSSYSQSTNSLKHLAMQFAQMRCAHWTSDVIQRLNALIIFEYRTLYYIRLQFAFPLLLFVDL